MEPVVFDGCFGWLHHAEGSEGVVLCNPFGYDALCTHRSWRSLAERLAASGMTVMRFDYPGTGDSIGAEEDTQRVESWVASIVAAVRYLKSRTDVSRVSLCGLRLGATLAALAAQQLGDVESLVLLAPAISGKNYLRELRAHRQSWLSTPAGMNAAPIPEGVAYVEAFGFGLHGDDVARLGTVDLLRDTQAPARRVLILDSKDRTRADALINLYAQHGVAAQRMPFDEADRLMIEALYSQEPLDAFAHITQWLSDPSAQRSEPHPAARREPREAQSSMLVADGMAREHHVVFGHYFGIYCEPETPKPGAPAVLLINTGASHHIGDGRIFVLFARRLAAQGIASLRMDLGGLGDSTPRASTVTLDTIYSDQSRVDAMAGADWLDARGHTRTVVFGVCGGAFVGLHACAAHPRVVGCFGVNLQKFIWDGAARAPGTDGLASTRVLRRSAMSAAKWKKVLRGETSLKRVVHGLASRVARSAYRRGSDVLVALTGARFGSSPAHRLLRVIEQKKAQVRLAYGNFDLGLDELALQFGARQGALRRFGSVQTVTLPGLDHALFTETARQVVMADAEAWITSHFIATADAAKSTEKAVRVSSRLTGSGHEQPAMAAGRSALPVNGSLERAPESSSSA